MDGFMELWVQSRAALDKSLLGRWKPHLVTFVYRLFRVNFESYGSVQRTGMKGMTRFCNVVTQAIAYRETLPKASHPVVRLMLFEKGVRASRTIRVSFAPSTRRQAFRRGRKSKTVSTFSAALHRMRSWGAGRLVRGNVCRRWMKGFVLCSYSGPEGLSSGRRGQALGYSSHEDSC